MTLDSKNPLWYIMDVKATTQIVAKVVDLSTNPGVIERLRQEQATDPSITGLHSPRMALVAGNKGTYVVLENGSFYRTTIEDGRILVGLQLYYNDKPNKLLTATFKEDEFKAGLTGEEMTVDEFVLPGELNEGRLRRFVGHLNPAKGEPSR